MSGKSPTKRPWLVIGSAYFERNSLFRPRSLSRGLARITWRTPSAVFAPYESADLDAMARELDAIWEDIVRDTVGG